MNKTAILLVTLCLGAITNVVPEAAEVEPAKAESPQAQPLPENHAPNRIPPAYQVGVDGIVALIAAPPEVQAHQTRSIPIRISLQNLKDDGDTPDRVVLVTTAGSWTGTTPIGDGNHMGELWLRLAGGEVGLELDMVDWQEQDPIEIEVRSSTNGAVYGSARIFVRTAVSAEWVERPARGTILPVGKSKPVRMRMRFRDQFGQVLSGLPCSVMYSYPEIKGVRPERPEINGVRFMQIVTDDEGIAAVTLPESTKEGDAYFKFDVPGVRSGFVEVTYRKSALSVEAPTAARIESPR